MVKPTPKGSVRSARKRSPNTLFYVALAILAVAGIATLAFVATRGSQRQVVTLDPNLPPVQSEGYVIGSPSAPIEVLEFADFECPACAQFATLHGPDVKSRLVNTGQIRLRFLDFPLVEIASAMSPGFASVRSCCAKISAKS